jgi:hypothetical protein
MKLDYNYLVIGVIIVYIAFFSHPPPRFVSQLLDNPVGQIIALVGVLYAFSKKPLLGLFLGIAYLTSSYPTLEYMDESKPEEKKQPKSGAPKVDPGSMGKIQQLLKGAKLPMQSGKDVKSPPPATHPVKSSEDGKEHFAPF